MTDKKSLEACPSSLNCVSSQSASEKHNISPISYNSSSDHAYETILKVLNNMSGTKVVEEAKDYIRAECKSKWLKVVSDLEFLLDESKKIIDVRAASRVGYTDLGVNRKRVEYIRQKFIQKV
ncbi:DUF1499 domain-containing protein [Pseudalkalibacillus sp. R45]|uniref:DUF1499 domain-containing protein n=1 Tax=Pseudalkalibacillus sp. R45 TaxID=3457433 RepID=UPI003FCE8499